MKTVNKQVAIKELKIVKESKAVVRGLDLDDGQTMNLISSTVLMNSDSYTVGTVLYFRADVVRLSQARTKYKLNDLEFILMPEDAVVAFDAPKADKAPALKQGEEYHP